MVLFQEMSSAIHLYDISNIIAVTVVEFIPQFLSTYFWQKDFIIMISMI